MAASEVDEPLVYVTRQRGGCFAVPVLFLVFPLMGLGSAFSESHRPWAIAMPASAVVAALLVYRFFNMESRLELDARGLRLSHRDIVFGVPRKAKVDWEIPLEKLTQAREVTTRTPARGGGWSHSTVLHLPGGHKLAPGEFGNLQDPASPYNEFKKMLKRRLGERFTTEQVT